jgi:hypothetical protein
VRNLALTLPSAAREKKDRSEIPRFARNDRLVEDGAFLKRLIR